MTQRSALVTAAGGIGDIVRMTPLVGALSALGYDVDVLIAPDFAGTVGLFEGAPAIRRLFHVPSRWREREPTGSRPTGSRPTGSRPTGSRPTGSRPTGSNVLAEQVYDVATYTVWSAELRALVSAQRSVAFDRREWLAEGDSRCATRLAALLGWSGPLPPPFVVAPEIDFGLAPGTIALHPGCKRGWPWKRWHGFDEMARALPHVVVVGTDADRDNTGTYFGRRFEWPDHAVDFTDRLSIGETAALIGQCAALVSNDSGLMHVGVALGTPTFGVFGLTSPAREAIPARNMIPITKGLSCEPACRRQPWGRRDCDHHLACLKTLTADEVLARVAERVDLHRVGSREWTT